MRKSGLLAGLAGLCASAAFIAPALGDETFNGSGGPLVDHDGTNNGVAFFTISVSGTNATVDSLESITFTTLTHTWLGDLVIALVAPDDLTFVTVTSPPALENANLNGTYTFEVDDVLPFQFQTLDEVSGPLGDNDVVPTGTYAASDWGDGDFGPRLDWADMQGVALDGDWVLQIHDFFQGDTGALGSWSFTVAIPEPASAGALAVGALALLRRRVR